jgi:hypothetical protein
MVSKTCRKVPQSIAGGNRTANRWCDLTVERGAPCFTKLYIADKPQKSRPVTFAVIAFSQRRTGYERI